MLMKPSFFMICIAQSIEPLYLEIEPTWDPTSNPTTPSPLHPGEMVCGDTQTGDYNDEGLDFEVRMLFEGNMTFDASGSDFEISVLSSGNSTTDASDGSIT